MGNNKSTQISSSLINNNTIHCQEFSILDNLLQTKKGMLRVELLPFLNLNDTANVLRLNKAASQIIIDQYSKNWNALGSLIAQTYMIDNDLFQKYFNSYDEFKNSKDKVVKIQDTEHTYFRCNTDKKVIEYLAYAGFQWAWKDDPRYYTLKSLKHNTFGLMIPFLIEVCWFDPNAIAQNVKPGKYDLYILHGIAASNNIVERADIFIESSPAGANQFKQLFKDDYMKESHYETMALNKITKDHITTIDLRDEQENVDVKMRFFNKGGDWKKNWYFEGFILEVIKEQ